MHGAARDPAFTLAWGMICQHFPCSQVVALQLPPNGAKSGAALENPTDAACEGKCTRRSHLASGNMAQQWS
ncbi:hypothetical protein N431DRAFT_426088 [Stipitochalara longipes BDJ]|nr:hypothetical protein N431DRAFT_426088 [Stipitochalara longipes BDJ]